MKRIVLGLGLVIVSFFVGFLCWDNRESRFRSQIRDLQLQLAESVQKVDTFFIHDSIPVWKERIVEVDRTDYKRELADRQLIQELGLRVSQVEAENRLLMATRDTVVLVAESDSLLTYRDKWLNVSFDPSSRVLGCEVWDSLNAFVAREYKHKFLWLRWGTKGYNVYIVNHNPHSRIEYNKYIRVKK